MKTQNIYIGNTTKNGIYLYEFKNKKLVSKGHTNDFEKCTYLANDKTHLYSVIEIEGTKEENNGYVVAYKKENGNLINIDKKSSYGKGPCHIEIDNKHKMLFVSNYIDGYMAILEKEDDGTFGKKIYSKVNIDTMSHSHCTKKLMNNSFFVSVDLGADLVTAYEIKEKQICEISKIQFEKGAEPRHIAVSKDYIYLVTEKSCKLFVLKLENKKLKIVSSVSILPNNIKQKENYTGCAIKLSKNLKNIYVSVRGHNSISVFKVQNERVKMIQNISCMGDVPRDLELDETNGYVFVANQCSNDVAIFKRNKFGGKLKYLEKEIVIEPTCIIAE